VVDNKKNKKKKKPMLSFRRTLNFPKYDLKSHSKAMIKTAGQLLRESAREWLRVLIESNLPVETGMAAATLEPLARYLNVAFDINPKRKPYFSKLEGVIQSVPTGRKKSGFTILDDTNNGGSAIFQFQWETDVLHFWLSDYYRGEVSGEVRLQEANEAFIEHMNTGLATRMPGFAKHVKIRRASNRSDDG
jgi:hypothetical protein